MKCKYCGSDNLEIRKIFDSKINVKQIEFNPVKK